MRQLLIEGGLLGAAGAAGGLALSPLLAVTLVRLMTSADPGSEPYSASVDGRVLLLLFSLVMAAVGAMLQARAGGGIRQYASIGDRRQAPQRRLCNRCDCRILRYRGRVCDRSWHHAG